MKNNFNIAFIRFALLLVTLLQSLNVVQAQTYPVQVNVNTAGPYYNYLSYYADENFHLQAVVTLTDFNSAPVQARLRLKIEGPGYTAITKPGVVVGSTFTLSPGMPEFVKGIDLAPYFYENNLLVTPSGINLNNLPEGFTTICVEVINDSPAQEVLSTNNCTSFFLQRFQPSQLVFPACGSSVNPSEQFHTFQWTPPVGFVPSIGTEINYTFSLYEWNDPNNYNIFQTGQGLVYTTQTSNPLVQLSSFDITFQEGLTYVWRIEAQILSNGLEVNMLENNGVSSPCTFVYGEVQSLEESLADGLTIDLNTSSEGERKGRAYWTVIDNTPGEGLSTFSSFVVAYRKQPTGNEEFDLTWFEDTVSSFSQFIYQLEPSTTYEVKIAGIAGDFVSDYSEVETFTTNAPRNYACGDQDLPFRPANYTPLENALVGMVFQIGQFDMTITQITPTGSAGHYSGKGMIPVAFLGGARAKVKFDDILVDDQYLVREGQVDVVTKGVENWLSEEYLSMVDPIDVQGQITAYGFANDSTVWAVVNGDTLTWTFQNDLPIVIHGEGNVEIQYWPDGHIVVTTYDTIPSTDSLSATASLNIQFEEVVGQEAYFDKKEHDHFAENYEAITCAGNFVYWVPNASRRKTESRQVKAVFHGYDEILDVSKVKFEMNGGYTIAQHTVLNDSTYLVTLPIKDFDYQLYAKYDTLKMGKLNVKSFAQVTKNIKIVPLVPLNYSSTDVSQSLTNLYQGAHVNCVVSIDSLFNTSEFNSSTVFANPEVNGMLHYTEQMRNLREAYFLNHELENDTYLVFVINEFEDALVDGYMVRGKGLGFVTQSSLTTLETFTHTLGHELGHGIGGLEHAWGDAASKKNTTDNLMDYSGGTTLTNNQWQALHNSENVFSLLDSEEDGMIYGGMVAYFQVVMNGDVCLNRVPLYRTNWLQTKNKNHIVKNEGRDYYTVVHKVWENGEFQYSHEHKRVVYYNFIFDNSQKKYKRYFGFSSDSLISYDGNYKKYANEIYTVKRYFKNNKFIFETAIKFNGEVVPLENLYLNIPSENVSVGDIFFTNKIGDQNALNGDMLATERSIWDKTTKADYYILIATSDTPVRWSILGFGWDSGAEYMWDEQAEWYIDKYKNNWDNPFFIDITNAVGGVVSPFAQMAIDLENGIDPFRDLKNAYKNYDGTFVGFVYEGIKNDLSDFVDDLAAGGYRREKALWGAWVSFTSSGAMGSPFLKGINVIDIKNKVRSLVVNGAGDFLPNLLNKVDNVIDDVGNASLQVADVTDEIVKGSNSLSDAAKKFWANHEVNCTKYLRETHGNANVGRQITVDVTLSNGQVVTCRLDNLVKQGNSYKIIDAKSSIINNLGTKNVDDLISQYATTNQKIFYDALKNGQVQSIKPRGQRAQQFFKVDSNADLFNINIGNNIEFLVNDVATDGYNIYKKTFTF